MEARLLAGAMSTDTHTRLGVAEELMDYFKHEDHSPEDFPEFDRLISSMAAWMGSSNFKVSVASMEISCLLIQKLKDRFKPHIPTVFPPLKERLGDARDQPREQAQLLIQQIMRDVVSSPQAFLDRLLDATLTHKNWRVKEQGLVCLARTLNYFGSGQVTVSKFMNIICNLLGDANSQVRSCAVETIVEIYRHVGVKVRIDLSRRGIPSSRMSVLTTRFDEIDATSNTVHSDSEEVDDDRESLSSCGSSASARTHGSSRSVGSRSARTAPSTSSRPPSVAGGGGGSGGLEEADFERGFQETPHVNIFTQHDLERTVATIDATLGDTQKAWEQRVSALKELRAVAKHESVDHQHFLSLLHGMNVSLLLSLKDLRSQVTREACITLSYLSVMLGSEFAHFAEQMLPQLINLLPNSAKVMATSAELCMRYMFKYIHTARLLQPLSNGLGSKSPVVKKQCASFVSLVAQSWETGTLERSVSLMEGMLKKGLVDSDAATRKHIRRAYWGYHRHFPSQANRLFDSLDQQLQKHISEERAAMEREGGGRVGGAQTTTGSLKPLAAKRKRPPPVLSSHSETDLLQSQEPPAPFHKAPTLGTITTSSLSTSSPLSPSSPISPTHSVPPSIRLIRPTIKSPRNRRRTDPTKTLRAASSVDNLDRNPSPLERPPSRTGSRAGMRPPSRTGIPKAERKGSSSELLPSGKRRLSRSTQASPTGSRESSPTRTIPQQSATLTTEAMLKLYGVGGSYDDDDNASVTSERSTFSISSEVSVSPYTKYPTPITDLTELVAMCSSQQWSERRDGIAQLHMLLESPRPFSHADLQQVKAVFRRMFMEPHTKVYGMFLDTLSRFIEERREHLDDWLFLLLLRLLHKQGTDMLSSVHYKLMLVLELVRKSFEAERQFAMLCRILIDQTQPMNHKVKLAWLEYLHELLPLLDSTDFKDTTDSRQALGRLLAFTMEPKSAEIRRSSQKTVTGLFELNPATLTLMLPSVPKPLQESANKILKGYMQANASSGDEAEPPPSTPSPSKQRKRYPSTPSTPQGASRISAPSPSPSSRPPRYRPTTPQRTPRPSPASSLIPSSSRGLIGARNFSVSTPDMRENGRPAMTRSTSKSRIPTPGSRLPLPRRPGTAMGTPMSTPTSTPRSARRRVGPARAQSVDPEKMAKQLLNDRLLQRPSSTRSDYNPSLYQNGSREGRALSPSSIEHFSFSDLPNLDYGSPDEEEVEVTSKDHMTHVLRELQTSSSSKLRYIALQSLYTLSREYPEKCNWEEHFKTTLLKLVETISDADPGVRTVSLRVLREILKTQHDRLRDYAELTTMKVLKAFADTDASVSQAAEDLFTLLAPALPSESAIELLSPMVAREKHPMLLGTIKLLTKVISLAEEEYLQGKLKEVIPGVIRGYSHSESSVRKASVFCLVAIHSVVGEKLRDHLTKLSSSQTKLLDLYIRRHQQAAAAHNGPKR